MIAMSLSSRLERVMNRTPTENIEEFRQLDLETMSLLEKVLDQYEESHGMVPLKNPEDLQGVVLPRSKCMPKSKAMPAHQVPVEVIEEIVDPSDPWDVMDYTALQQDQTNEMIEALQARVLNMEGAISEILGHLRQGK